MDLSKKLEIIENSASIGDLTLDVLPLVFSDAYYFVSYSHKDYKKVYKDILLLQENGVPLWYDRGMRPGADWRDVAESAMSKYACKGVIFYLSENSIKSDAVFEEFLLTKKYGKSFCSVNLSNNKGEVLSAMQMAKNLNLKEDKIKIIEEMFPDTVLYMSETDKVEIKKDGIFKLVEPKLLHCSTRKNISSLLGEKHTVINSVADIDVKKVVIPNAILDENDNSYPVEYIDKCAFANCRRLKEISLPNTLKTIDEYAFLNCENLLKITIPKGVNKISNYTFSRCYLLNEINLLGEITDISQHAFSYCKSLKEFNACKQLKNIEKYAFFNCENLSNVSLPTTITTISEGVFSGCENLKTVNFYEVYEKVSTVGSNGYLTLVEGENLVKQNITKIEKSAFKNCKNLQNIELLGSYDIIPKHAFKNCKNLSNVKISNFVTKIDEEAFLGCESLTKITLPNMLESINLKAFSNCVNLKEINLPNSVKSIGIKAFENCKNLTVIKLPNELKNISSNAFDGCDNLKEIYYPITITISNVIKLKNDGVNVYYNDTVENVRQAVKQLNYLQDGYFIRLICTDGIYDTRNELKENLPILYSEHLENVKKQHPNLFNK